MVNFLPHAIQEITVSLLVFDTTSLAVSSLPHPPGHFMVSPPLSCSVFYRSEVVAGMPAYRLPDAPNLAGLEPMLEAGLKTSCF